MDEWGSANSEPVSSERRDKQTCCGQLSHIDGDPGHKDPAAWSSHSSFSSFFQLFLGSHPKASKWLLSPSTCEWVSLFLTSKRDFFHKKIICIWGHIVNKYIYRPYLSMSLDFRAVICKHEDMCKCVFLKFKKGLWLVPHCLGLLWPSTGHTRSSLASRRALVHVVHTGRSLSWVKKEARQNIPHKHVSYMHKHVCAHTQENKYKHNQIAVVQLIRTINR